MFRMVQKGYIDVGRCRFAQTWRLLALSARDGIVTREIPVHLFGVIKCASKILEKLRTGPDREKGQYD